MTLADEGDTVLFRLAHVYQVPRTSSAHHLLPHVCRFPPTTSTPAAAVR